MVGGIASPIAAAVLMGALVGFLFGRAEADETRFRVTHKDARKLPHALLLLIRAVVLVPVGGVFHADRCVQVLLWAIAMAACASVHRIAYNARCRVNGHSVTRAWWYMGSCRRYVKDSWYDTLCWIVSARRLSFHRTEDGSTYLCIRPWSYAMPWAVAQFAEAAVIAGAILALHWRQI